MTLGKPAHHEELTLLQTFVPDTSQLPPGFLGKSYNSRKKVAQAHGISAAAMMKRPRAPDSNARSGAEPTCCAHYKVCEASRPVDRMHNQKV